MYMCMVKSSVALSIYCSWLEVAKLRSCILGVLSKTQSRCANSGCMMDT